MIVSIRSIPLQILLVVTLLCMVSLSKVSADDGTASRCYIVVDGATGTNKYYCCEYEEVTQTTIFGVPVPGTQKRVECTLVTDDPGIMPVDGDTDVDEDSVSSEPDPETEPEPATVQEICDGINGSDDTVIMPPPGSQSSSEQSNEATDLEILCEAFDIGDMGVVCSLLDMGVIDVSDEEYAELCM